MGCAVATVFGTVGWSTHVVEIDEAARLSMNKRIEGVCKTIGANAPAIQVAVSETLAAVDWDDVDIVVECVCEDIELKQRVFAELESYCPESTPLTSNSSSFPISQIARGLETRHRMLGLHFFMPAQLVPAVEVISSDASAETVAVYVADVMRAVGKKPIRVKRDVPGFLGNRIQHALMREAIALVEEGFASAEDVDAVVRYGFGLRYVAGGPLLQKDLAGIDIHCAAAATIYPYLHNNERPSPYMSQLVADGTIGVKASPPGGFYCWTPEQVDREQSRYESALFKAVQILSDENTSEG